MMYPLFILLLLEFYFSPFSSLKSPREYFISEIFTFIRLLMKS